MKWADVKPGDIVYHNRKRKRVDSITELNYNVWDTSDKRPHLEIEFSYPVKINYYGPFTFMENGEQRFRDGLFCILASKKVTMYEPKNKTRNEKKLMVILSAQKLF